MYGVSSGYAEIVAEMENNKDIKTKVIGKLEIGSLLPYVCTFLKDDNKFHCCNYHDYTFIPFEISKKHLIKVSLII